MINSFPSYSIEAMSFSLLLNSVNGTQVVSTFDNNIEYNVDWNALSNHKGKFEVRSNLVTTGSTTQLTASSNGKCLAEWGVIPDVFDVSPAGRGIRTCPNIMMFHNGQKGTNASYITGVGEGVPVILTGLPQSNQFRIRFQTVTGGLFGSFQLNDGYSLFLYFKAI